jgi:DNA repair and recombination protein RAD54B
MVEFYLNIIDEITIFCRPSQMQITLYERIINARAIRSIFNDSHAQLSAQHLTALDALRKLCNHPAILWHSVNERQLDDNGKDGDVSFEFVFFLDKLFLLEEYIV